MKKQGFLNRAGTLRASGKGFYGLLGGGTVRMEPSRLQRERERDAHIHTYMYVCVCMSVCMYACMVVRQCVCVCVCVSTFASI